MPPSSASPASEAELDQVGTERVRARRDLFQRFLRDVLGVSAWQADADACKFEHLVSGETAEHMARFIRFLNAPPEQAEGFLAAWRADQQAGEGETPSRPAVQ